MGKKLKGGRRQILQLEEKKPPKVSSKTKVKHFIHYSDSDDDSKKSNESESSSSAILNQTVTPMDSKIADFFKEIDALTVPEDLIEEDKKSTDLPVECEANKGTIETPNLESQCNIPSEMSNSNPDVAKVEGPFCPWQEIHDDSTGYSYYWNVNTNEVTWDCPLEYTLYIQSINSVHIKSNELDSDERLKRKKKESPQLPEGAIIPISYFGDSSSSDELSDTESELSKQPVKQKPIKATKKLKIKKDLKNKSDKKESSTELIGPQLPPDFQFPQDISSVEAEVSRNSEECAGVETALLTDSCDEKPSQSNFNGLMHESPKIAHNITSPESKEIEDTHNEDQPDSTVTKQDNLLNNCTTSQASSSTFGFRSVVAYDSFTDDDDEIETSTSTSSQQVIVDVPKSKKVRVNQEVVENENISCMKQFIQEEENKLKGLKRKAEDVLKEKDEEVLKEKGEEESVKKAKHKNVNIDELFATHTAYGKYGFGFGWQKQLDTDIEDEFNKESKPNFRAYKSQNDYKAISFVKSNDVLDLKTLNEDLNVEESREETEDKGKQNAEDTEEFSNVKETEDVEKPEDVVSKMDTISEAKAEELDNKVQEVEIPKDDDIIHDDKDADSSKTVVILKGEHGDVIVRKKKENTDENEVAYAIGLASLEVERDVDEIDRALCEALDAKRAAKKLSSSTSCTQADEQNNLKEVSKTSSKELNENDSGSDNGVESTVYEDKNMETIFELASSLIDKLTFLLSNHSTLASHSAFLIQLQTRFVDWQAGALDNKYFSARLSEVEQYLQHYEISVVSGDWSCQWDRINKRYFYVNKRSQLSQWTYPQDLLTSEKTSWISEAGPSNLVEHEELEAVTSSSSIPQSHSQTPTPFILTSKDICGDSTSWRNEPSPPPPPPGVDSPPPPPPPRTPPPDSPPPPPPDSTETGREPEDMDLENSNDSSSFRVLSNRHLLTSDLPRSALRSSSNIVNSSSCYAVSSTSATSCEDWNAKCNVSRSYLVDSSDGNSAHKLQTTSISEKVIPDSGTLGNTETNIHDQPSNMMTVDASASSTSSGVCSSQSDSTKTFKAAGTASKKEKKKTKLQLGLGLKKKNIPSLVEKWLKIKEEAKDDSD